MGSKGQDVASLQNYLISLDYLGKNLNTGYFGAMTKVALRKYQKDKGLPQTGFFGLMTRQKIDSDMNITSYPKPEPVVGIEGDTWYVAGRDDAWVKFSQGKVQGKICNTFSGTLTVDKELRIHTSGDIVSTMMFCTDTEIQNLETTFHKLIKSESKIVIGSNGFAIVGSEGEIRFTKMLTGATKKDVCTRVGGTWSGTEGAYTCTSYDIERLSKSVCDSLGGTTYTSCGSPVGAKSSLSGEQFVAPAVCVAICGTIK